MYDKDELLIILAFYQNPLGKLVVVTMRSSNFWNLTGNPLNFVFDYCVFLHLTMHFEVTLSFELEVSFFEFWNRRAMLGTRIHLLVLFYTMDQ